MLAPEQQQTEEPSMLDRAERIRLLELAAESGSPPDLLTTYALEYEDYIMLGRTAVKQRTEPDWAADTSHHDKGH